MRLARRWTVLPVAALALVCAGVATPAESPAQIVAKLNAERVANGIPGAIGLDSATTVGCQHHIRYEELNGILFTHQEAPGSPGYTPDGAAAAGAGDQAFSGGWESGDPYDNLPLHLANLLDPALSTVGASEHGVRTCVVLVARGRTFPADTVFTYPGNGRRDVPPSQLVRNESPFSPGDLVGLQQGQVHGPTILMYAEGPWAGSGVHLDSLKLTGPRNRPVALRVVGADQIAPNNPAGAFFAVVVSPLEPRSIYRATATFVAGSVTHTKRWSFTTAAA